MPTHLQCTLARLSVMFRSMRTFIHVHVYMKINTRIYNIPTHHLHAHVCKCWVRNWGTLYTITNPTLYVTTHMHAHTHTCTCTFICTVYGCVCVYVHCTYMYVCMYVCVYACMYTYVSMHAYMYVWIQVYVYMHEGTCIYMYRIFMHITYMHEVKYMYTNTSLTCACVYKSWVRNCIQSASIAHMRM